MTHVPMLSTFALETLRSGGRIVHGVSSMRLESVSGETVLARAYAEASYLLEAGLAVVSSETHSTATTQYQRVILAQ